MDVKNRFSCGSIGRRYVQNTLKSAAAQQSRVDHLWTVGCGNNDDTVEGFDTIHTGEKLIDNTIAYVAALATRCISHACNGLKLIKENDGWRGLLSLLENLSNTTLRFTDPLGNHFRALNGDEVGLRFVGDGLGEERLTSTRCPEQDNPSWWFDVEVLENLRLGERPLDRFLESVFDFVKSTNFVPSNFRNFDIDFTQSRWLNVLDSVTEIGHPDFHLLKNFGGDGLFIEIDFW